MKQNNIEKSSAELLDYIETLIANVPAPKESEVNKSIEKIIALTFGNNNKDNLTV